MSSSRYSSIFGIIIFTIGILNIVLVHPVPGIIFLLMSLLYLPAANTFFRQTFGFSFPLWVKIALGVIGIWFTLGVSDLGDILDDVATPQKLAVSNFILYRQLV